MAPASSIVSRIMDWAGHHKGLVMLGIGWMALFGAGLQYYVGSGVAYWVFSLVSLAVLVSGLIGQRSYSYLFLVIFLWLGFWFKLTANFLLFGYFPFGEPIGRFDSSPEAWDLVLWISVFACLGAMLGRVMWVWLPRFKRERVFQGTAPSWYSSTRRMLWIGLGVFTVAIALINALYGVQQIGLAPRTVFPWPLNAVIAWSLNIGCALGAAVLTGWDIASGRKLTWQPCVILAEALVSAMTIISRSAYLFHAIPALLGLKAGGQISHYTRRQLMLFTGSALALFLVSIAAVSFMRDYQYRTSQAKPVSQPVAVVGGDQRQPPATPAATTDAQPGKPAISSFRWILLHQLIVNRWIGLEGAMSASAHDGRGTALLEAMLVEKREVGKATAYQQISQSGYQTDDPKFQFASTPGLAGFMYLGGSLWLVMAGVAVFVLVSIAGEELLLSLTQNPVFCSLYGVTAANAAAQFGVTPRQDLPQFMMIFIMAFAVYLLQKAFRRQP
jgi:hypothetical protein